MLNTLQYTLLTEPTNFPHNSDPAAARNVGSAGRVITVLKDQKSKTFVKTVTAQ